MEKNNKLLLQYVYEDLQILEEDFGSDTFQGARIRNASAILNKLFNENNLQKAWRFAVSNIRSPYIFGPRLEYLIENDPSKLIVNGVAGGANLDGIFYALAIVNEGNRSIDINPNIDPINHKYKLNEYFESIGLILNKKSISRFEIIKYSANKAGGKHIDFKRNESTDNTYKLIDEGLNNFKIFDKNTLELELHSIIHNVLKSEDIVLLRSKLKEQI
jgi:hypothetical protein